MSGIYEGPHGEKLYGDGKRVQDSRVTAREDQPQLGTCDYGPISQQRPHAKEKDCKNWRPEDQPRPTLVVSHDESGSVVLSPHGSRNDIAINYNAERNSYEIRAHHHIIHIKPYAANSVEILLYRGGHDKD